MRTVLLFGFDDLRATLAVAGIAERAGAAVRSVPARDWSLTLSSLAAGETGGNAPTPAAGQMLVFCELDRELDAMLPLLREAGVACPKAVLTRANRAWTAQRLYRELLAERAALSPRV